MSKSYENAAAKIEAGQAMVAAATPITEDPIPVPKAVLALLLLCHDNGLGNAEQYMAVAGSSRPDAAAEFATVLALRKQIGFVLPNAE